MANSLSSARAYVEAVSTGKRLASKLLKAAVKRHEKDLKSAKKRGLYFDEMAAKKALAFFGLLKHSKGEWAGQAFELSDWQAFIVASVFGWKREDGTRRFRRVYIEVPRKNGKSTLLAGMGLYLLIADGEPGAEIYSAATKRDQARITHGEAIAMVNKSPLLKQEVKVFKDNINVLATRSKFEPLGADADTMDGLNIHGAIIDELHAHKTRAVVDVLDTATGSRRQPLIIEITTAGWDKTSVCWEHHEYSRQVLQGTLEDDSWFAFVAGVDVATKDKDGKNKGKEKDDDWQDEKTWEKANPNYGISVKVDDLRRKAKRAKAVPAEQNNFKRLHLDMWTEQSEKWMDMDEWDACDAEVQIEKGQKCYAGLDLASTTDIAALVLVFPDEEEPEGYDVLPFFWIPRDNMVKRTEKSGIPYLTWFEQGLLLATEGNVIDYEAILLKLDELAQLYDIKEVAYDRWGATKLIQEIQDKGLEVIPFGQGFASMSPPTKELMNLTLARRIRHGGHLVLRWMAGNMVVKTDPAGNLKPDKSKSAEKIDGMVALVMALDRAQRQENGPSAYDEHDLLVIG